MIYVRKWIVPSHTTVGKEYLVSLTEHGEYQCSCMHWINRHLECSHIRDVKADPSKYEVSLDNTTIGIELNPTRRDDKTPHRIRRKQNNPNPSVR